MMHWLLMKALQLMLHNPSSYSSVIGRDLLMEVHLGVNWRFVAWRKVC